jgi:histidyl-tRNA synthetase
VAGVRAELEQLGVTESVAARLLDAISITGSPDAVVRQLRERTRLGASEAGSAALSDLADFFGYLAEMGVPPERYAFDISTVRGLSYYTGIIYETYAAGAEVGSLCSGGRYDELIGQFTGRSLPCVGISFGIDRIFTAMDLLGLSASAAATATLALVTLLGKENVGASFRVAAALRAAGLRTEVYADETRPLKRQLDFADKKGVPLVAIIGDTEREAGTVALRDMRRREQETLAVGAAVERARALLGLVS